MHRDGVISVIEQYAAHIKAPVETEVDVRSVSVDEDGRFILDAGTTSYTADNVILATGPYQRTLIPEVAQQIPGHIRQLTASAYRNADDLPPGGVLVVGAGGSGVQITEDLLDAGRNTWLCVGNFRRIPRRYRGRDIMDWFEELNFTNQPVTDPDPTEHSPLLTGVNGGYEVDLRRVVAAGGTLLGRLEGVAEHELVLGDQLLTHMQAAEEAYNTIITGIEAALASQPIVADDPEPPPAAPGPQPPEPPTVLNLADANINTIIWATGYGVDFSWVNCGEYLDDGMPVQQRGVSTVPGLYFLGLFMMHSARSSFFWGVGDDAEHVVSHLSQRAG